MPSRALILLASCGLVSLASLGACLVPNISHCGNLDGDATCLMRDPGRPHCSLCEASNDGCVAEPVTVEGCHKESDSGAAGSTAASATTSTPTTSAASTGIGPGTTSTGTSTGTGASTGTTEGTSTSTSTSTGTSTTADTTETPGTGSSTTGGPVCGDGKAEGNEACDETDLKGKNCADVDEWYGGGKLACNDTCDSYVEVNCCRKSGKPCVLAAQCCSNSCLGLCLP